MDDLPKLPPKEATASTWVLGTTGTPAVIAVMIAGYWLSGTLARRRAAAASTAVPAGVLVGARRPAGQKGAPAARGRPSSFLSGHAPAAMRSLIVRDSGRSANCGHTSGPHAREPSPCCAASMKR